MANTKAEQSKIKRARRRAEGVCIFGCGKPAAHKSGLCDDCQQLNAARSYARQKPKFQRTGRHIGGKWIKESERKLT